MNKKKVLIIGIISLVLAVVVLSIVQYFITHRSIYIDLDNEIATASIYNKDMNGEPSSKVATLESSKKISLKNGGYIVIVEGDNVDKDKPVSFVVDSSTNEVAIHPNFTKEFLESLLTDDTEQNPKHVSSEDLTASIYNNIAVSSGADIIKGELVADGTWCVGIISQVDGVARMKFDQYKIILHLTDEGWVVMADQAFVFKYDKFPEIPREIIKFANEYEI